MNRSKCLIFLLPMFIVCFTIALPQEKKAASSKKIAVTFDDLPFVRMSGLPLSKVKEFADRLTEEIKAQKIPVIGFVNETKLYSHNKEDKRKIGLLENWLNAGLDLGNHTFSHVSAHEVPLAVFEADVIKGERIIKKLLNDKNKHLQYFRFPSLHTGMTLEAKLGIESFLRERGYTNAPATVVSREWLFAAAYAKAYDHHDNELMKKIGESYLEHIRKTVELCEKQSEYLFNRKIDQVLILHANELNADYFSRICEILKSTGYNFASLGEVLKDPAYSSEEKYLGRDGVSWLDRWAKTKGVDNMLFNGAPPAPDWIANLANQDY